MFEKVNPKHPDKLADIIAGMIVDIAYKYRERPSVAVEVLVGHGKCYIILESTVFEYGTDEVRDYIDKRVKEILEQDDIEIVFNFVPQNSILANAQKKKVVCGDNGIFRGVPITVEQQKLTNIAKDIYDKYETDGKYILADDDLFVCQSKAENDDIYDLIVEKGYDLVNDICLADVNPLGYWTGGIDVDSGATNRKLGSDMGDAITGGGLHGKDLSKADVSVNIYAHLLAQERGEVVEFYCAIGDRYIEGKPYEEIVELAKEYIKSIGGFEEFAKWGLIRPTN